MLEAYLAVYWNKAFCVVFSINIQAFAIKAALYLVNGIILLDSIQWLEAAALVVLICIYI